MLPARLIEPWNWLMRLKVRLVGVPPWVAPKRVSPWAMALIVAAAGPERVNSRAIEPSLTPAWTKNAGTWRHADLDGVARQVLAARGEHVIPAAVEIVGGGRITEAGR